jgi:hypothetical protein
MRRHLLLRVEPELLLLHDAVVVRVEGRKDSRMVGTPLEERSFKIHPPYRPGWRAAHPEPARVQEMRLEPVGRILRCMGQEGRLLSHKETRGIVGRACDAAMDHNGLVVGPQKGRIDCLTGRRVYLRHMAGGARELLEVPFLEGEKAMHHLRAVAVPAVAHRACEVSACALLRHKAFHKVMVRPVQVL